MVFSLHLFHSSRSKIMMILPGMVAGTLLSLLANTAALALKSDRDQPAMITADEIEMDFKTGERIYTGHVKIIQGTTRLNADKVIGRFSNDKLEKATAYGAPAVFKQRPDNADGDVTGSANKMVIDQTKQLLTLEDDATITQADGSTMKSARIDYNMETQKMKATGGTQTEVQPKNEAGTKPPKAKNKPAKPAKAKPEETAPKPTPVTKADTAADQSTTAAQSTTGSGRIKIVIPPKKPTTN
jgi:lipopolysaccharide export system protein LptA